MVLCVTNAAIQGFVFSQLSYASGDKKCTAKLLAQRGTVSHLPYFLPGLTR